MIDPADVKATIDAAVVAMGKASARDQALRLASRADFERHWLN